MSEISPKDPRRSLPAMNDVLALPLVSALTELYGRNAVMVQVRYVIESMRARLAAGGEDAPQLETAQPPAPMGLAALETEVAARLREQLGEPLERVINATGILLHTNLGRAPLPPEVAASLPELLTAYCDLEFDRRTGRRSDRNRSVEGWICQLTGASS